LDHSLVQILVVVASNQVRILIADVRKVINAIVMSIELVDLKTSPNWSIRINNFYYLILLVEKETV